MARDVYLAEDGSLRSDAGAVLSGAGQELLYAEVTTNQATTSTTYVDITGLGGTITIPRSPFVIVAQVPVLVEENATIGSVRLVGGTGPTQLFNGDMRAAAANDSKSIQILARIPSSFHVPTVGSQVTYKVQFKTSVATSDVTAFVEFAGVRGQCFISAWTLR